MSALVGVEVRRLLARRVVWLLSGLAVLGLSIAALVLFIRSSSGSIQVRLVDYRGGAEGSSALFTTLLAVVGTTFAGAEWHAGTMTTLLTWEPRRLRVFLAKALAVATVSFLGFVVLQALLFVTLVPASLASGGAGNVDPNWIRSTVGLVARGAVLAAMVALLGFSLAMVVRNTAGALAVVFVYTAILEPIIRAAKPAWQPWFLYDNIATFVAGHPVDFTLHPRTVAGAGMVVGGYVLALGLAALALFRARDIT